MTSLKYPIGLFEKPNEIHGEILNRWINNIQELPYLLNEEVKNMNNNDMSKTYREGSWHIRQIVHHIADSHMNAFARFKLGLTEELPTIKAYDENKWVSMADAVDTPINYSMTLLHALHERWANLLASLTEEQWERKLFHPGRNAEVSLWDLFAVYAWHGKHHVAHITTLRANKGW